MPKIEVIQCAGYTFIGKRHKHSNLNDSYDFKVWFYPCGHANNYELYERAKIGCYHKCQES